MSKLSFLQCVLCLSSAKLFAIFYVNKLLRMIEFYPNNFIDASEVALRRKHKNYITNVRTGRKLLS